MTDLRNQRRMAAEILKCGENRVWMDQDRLDEIAKAVTKEDIRVLAKGKAIKARQVKGISSGRKKYAAGVFDVEYFQLYFVTSSFEFAVARMLSPVSLYSMNWICVFLSDFLTTILIFLDLRSLSLCL